MYNFIFKIFEIYLRFINFGNKRKKNELCYKDKKKYIKSNGLLNFFILVIKKFLSLVQ